VEHRTAETNVVARHCRVDAPTAAALMDRLSASPAVLAVQAIDGRRDDVFGPTWEGRASLRVRSWRRWKTATVEIAPWSRTACQVLVRPPATRRRSGPPSWWFAAASELAGDVVAVLHAAAGALPIEPRRALAASDRSAPW
jgi:hypothetical protein